MADNIKYRFIQNVGDYFPSGYFGEDFLEKVRKCADVSTDEMKALCSPYAQLQRDYNEFKNFIINQNPRVKDAIKKTHDFHTRLLRILGYETDNAYTEPFVVNAEAEPIEMIPVRHILRRGSQVKMLIMEMQHLIPVGEQEPAGLFEQQYESEPDRNTGVQRYNAGQWEFVFKLDRNQYKISPAIINKAITQLFLMPDEHRPHFILMLAGNTVFLFDQDKWSHGSYLQFSLDELFTQARVPAFRLYFALFHLLLSKQTLAADSEQLLMDTIIEESYKNAYEVTKDLKEGVILAVETLANEALYYMKNVAHKPFGKLNPRTGEYDETDDSFESEVKDDCLTIVYRLLFVFYAESRTELGILPVNDEVYNRGYSLESLRDLEQVRLISQESRDGYFFDDSIRHMFRLLSSGHKKNQDMTGDKSFSVRPIDSPLFNDNRLKQLKDVRIRNVKWQEIIKALSLSRKKRFCGRISYANLGVNQLGSVYESLLAFRGFYAEEDYIEVHKAGDPSDGTFLVPYSRMGSFDIKEVLCDAETGEPKRLPKGTFVYRLNGRDRQKSASYYTPEVLTRSTVKYTLKAFIDEVAEGKRKPQELLDLKILEPAMGAAAFQNEVINQLAKAYMTYVEKKPAPDKYRDELQKVKAYIATHNVYGVDLNPTAIELGKLSLWLNVIHRDMEPPFFANRLAVGNAVIGAWLKVYSKSDVVAKPLGRRLIPTEWWTRAPHKIKFYQARVNRSVNDIYHFLLPDKAMLAVLSIKEMKQKYQAEATLMSARLKDWTAAIGEADFQKLQRISAKIDLLLHDCFETQVNIERLTDNKRNIWGVPGENTLNLELYAEKERIFDTRYRRDNAYYKLKMVMDYWCSLWFWEYNDAYSLPTRSEYWDEVEQLLDVSDDKLDKNTLRALARNTGDEQSMIDFGNERMTEEQAQIIMKSKDEILQSTRAAQQSLFADEEPPRFLIVKRMAERYRFFHPMLEFIEVFWLKGGFDIICGNPPWLKLEFDEVGIMSEKFPEVVIRKTIAPDVRAKKEQFLSNDLLREIYVSEQNEQACSTAFLNAYCNYPLLVGQKTNLYKCILTNTFELVNEQGYIGLLHPETVYDDPKGQPLRKEMYCRLRYHFQYQNELRLFAEVDHHTIYGDQLFGPRNSSPNFLSIHNLYHPNTVDACFTHTGHGICGGIKKDGKWNIEAHYDRIVHFSKEELKVLAKTFEGNEKDWEGAKLVNIQNREEIDVLRKIANFPTCVKDFSPIITTALNETHSVDSGIIERNTTYPNIEKYEMIYNGPQFHVGNPYYKTPRIECRINSDYDTINLTSISDNYIARTNYTPLLPLEEYKSLIKGFMNNQNSNGKEIYENWIEYYKVGFRQMLSTDGERTLICALLPRKSAHIHGVISTAFRGGYHSVDMAALCSSLVMDYFIKTLGSQNFFSARMESMPLGVVHKYESALRVRTLMLNCLSVYYKALWEENYNSKFIQEQWSLSDKRLKSFNTLTPEWTWDTPLRNYFERRMALIEIDVISAMALGLTLEELTMMYSIKFPVLQQNENDTWYDQKGNIVFTCSVGLKGVGVERSIWNSIKDLAPGATYEHTIDPQKSELYGGQQTTYYAPFTKCDRVEDYRRAWAHFEKQFNPQPL